MKQKMQTDFFKIKKITNFYKIKNYCTSTTYNNLMKETSGNITTVTDNGCDDFVNDETTVNEINIEEKAIGAIFVVKMDTVVLHHLVMFADYFKIGLYLVDGECKNIDRILIIKKDNQNWKRVQEFLKTDIEFESVSLY